MNNAILIEFLKAQKIAFTQLAATMDILINNLAAVSASPDTKSKETVCQGTYNVMEKAKKPRVKKPPQTKAQKAAYQRKWYAEHKLKLQQEKARQKEQEKARTNNTEQNDNLEQSVNTDQHAGWNIRVARDGRKFYVNHDLSEFVEISDSEGQVRADDAAGRIYKSM